MFPLSIRVRILQSFDLWSNEKLFPQNVNKTLTGKLGDAFWISLMFSSQMNEDFKRGLSEDALNNVYVYDPHAFCLVIFVVNW